MSDAGTDRVRVFYGIDFSGNHRMWTSGCRRSNVWIATAQERSGDLSLVDLRPVQQLRGRGHPFDRLVALLANDDYCAVGIDAPFSLPERHMPEGGWPGLLRDIAALPKDGRPFPRGEELVAYAERNVCLAEPKPLRRTEKLWRGRGLNVRSTLWDGARGGAAFTIACLTLLERVRAPTWPWSNDDRLLVEAFPACQLLEWGLEHRGYASSYPSPEREDIVIRVSERIEIPDGLREQCHCSPDALDAVLCLFAAKAAFEGLAAVGDEAAAEGEGWIAVHPA
ncbi:MAG: DUF429 domain-containing protein [Acidimicrobiaceae bacterium]|nr:DUF429 domain-containing protein [Acidimicrobiaceae bacterium]